MRRLQIFTPKGDQIGMKKHKYKQKRTRPAKHKEADLPQQLPVPSFTKHPQHNNIFRKKAYDGKFSREESYDLSTYFLFRDDPDAPELLTVRTECTAKSTAAPISDSDEHFIMFDFDPAVSFDLGIRNNSGKFSDENFPPPVLSKPDRVESEVTNSLAFVRETEDLQSSKKDSNKKSRPGSRFKFSPHNQYLSEHYDADRIQQALELLETPPENDTPVHRKRRPLHKEIFDDLDISIDDAQLSIDFAVEEEHSIDGFSLLHLKKNVRFDTQHPQHRSKELSRNPPNDQETQDSNALKTIDKVKYTVQKRSCSSFALDEDQGSDVYIPLRNHAPSEIMSVPNNQFSDVDFSDDNLSVNNALAVERFISAPRLCKGTKDVPSSIQVLSFDDGDQDFIVSPKSVDSKLSLNIIPSSESQAVCQTPKRRSRRRKNDDDVKSWNRVKNHIAQLPSIQILLSDDFEDPLPTGPIAGSRKSYGSPTGVDQFDERRPWRKPTIALEIDMGTEQLTSINEEKVIHQLKSQVRNILSSIPTDINIEKSNRTSYRGGTRISSPNIELGNDSISKIKSRRRNIEAIYSNDSFEPSLRSESTRSSIFLLKEKLRQIESGVSESKFHVVRHVVPLSIF